MGECYVREDYLSTGNPTMPSQNMCERRRSTKGVSWSPTPCSQDECGICSTKRTWYRSNPQEKSAGFAHYSCIVSYDCAPRCSTDRLIQQDIFPAELSYILER